MHPPVFVNGHQFTFLNQEDKYLIFKCSDLDCESTVQVSLDFKTIGQPSLHFGEKFSDLKGYFNHQKKAAESHFSFKFADQMDIDPIPSYQTIPQNGNVEPIENNSNPIEVDDTWVIKDTDSQIIQPTEDKDPIIRDDGKDQFEYDGYKYLLYSESATQKLYICAYALNCECEAFLQKNLVTGEYNSVMSHSKSCQSNKSLRTIMKDMKAKEWVDEDAKNIKEIIQTKKPITYKGRKYSMKAATKFKITYCCSGKKNFDCPSIILYGPIIDTLYKPTIHSINCPLNSKDDKQPMDIGNQNENESLIETENQMETELKEVNNETSNSEDIDKLKISNSYMREGKLCVKWKPRSDPESAELKSIIIQRGPIKLEGIKYSFSLWKGDNIYYSCMNCELGCKSVVRLHTESQTLYYPTVHTMDCMAMKDEIDAIITRMKLKLPIMLKGKKFVFDQQMEDTLVYSCDFSGCSKTVKLQFDQIMDDLSTSHSLDCIQKDDENGKDVLLNNLLKEAKPLVAELNPKDTVQQMIRHRAVTIGGFEYHFCTSRPSYLYYMCPYRKTLNCKATIKLDLLDKKWSDRGSTHNSSCSILNQLIREKYPVEVVEAQQDTSTNSTEEIIEGLRSKLPVAIDGFLMKHTWSGKYIHYHCVNRWISGRMCPAQLKYKVGDEIWNFEGTKHNENCRNSQLEGMKKNGIVNLYSDSSSSDEKEEEEKEDPYAVEVDSGSLTKDELELVYKVRDKKPVQIDECNYNFRDRAKGKYIYYACTNKHLCPAYIRFTPGDPKYITGKEHSQRCLKLLWRSKEREPKETGNSKIVEKSASPELSIPVPSKFRSEQLAFMNDLESGQTDDLFDTFVNTDFINSNMDIDGSEHQATFTTSALTANENEFVEIHVPNEKQVKSQMRKLAKIVVIDGHRFKHRYTSTFSVIYLCVNNNTPAEGVCKAAIHLNLSENKLLQKGKHSEICLKLLSRVNNGLPVVELTDQNQAIRTLMRKTDAIMFNGLKFKLEDVNSKSIIYHCHNYRHFKCKADIRVNLEEMKVYCLHPDHSSMCLEKTAIEERGISTPKSASMYTPAKSMEHNKNTASPAELPLPESSNQKYVIDQMLRNQDFIEFQGMEMRFESISKRSVIYKCLNYRSNGCKVSLRLDLDEKKLYSRRFEHLPTCSTRETTSRSYTSSPEPKGFEVFPKNIMKLIKTILKGDYLVRIDGHKFRRITVNSLTRRYRCFHNTNKPDSICNVNIYMDLKSKKFYSTCFEHSEECTNLQEESDSESSAKAQVRTPRSSKSAGRGAVRYEDLSISMDDDGPKKYLHSGNPEGRKKSKRMRRSFIEWENIFQNDEESEHSEHSESDTESFKESSENRESSGQISEPPAKLTKLNDPASSQSEGADSNSTSLKKKPISKKRVNKSKKESEKKRAKVAKKTEEQLWEERALFRRTSTQPTESENEDNQWAALLSKFPNLQKNDSFEDHQAGENPNNKLPDLTYRLDDILPYISSNNKDKFDNIYDNVDDLFNVGPKEDAEINWNLYTSDDNANEDDLQLQEDEVNSILTVSISSSEGDIEKYKRTEEEKREYRNLIKEESNQKYNMEKYFNLDYQGESDNENAQNSIGSNKSESENSISPPKSQNENSIDMDFDDSVQLMHFDDIFQGETNEDTTKNWLKLFSQSKPDYHMGTSNEKLSKPRFSEGRFTTGKKYSSIASNFLTKPKSLHARRKSS
ncbi:hypothetical protein HDV04_005936 [Boothiomyces sp. JEL0838]|nr:hypothetical protein HDV04_005936 [Boothiomyces sp. JEL0838]